MPEQGTASGHDVCTPHVLLGVTGCIAAYKACEVLRGLQKRGCDVRVVMTESATRFVGPATFEALSGHEVALDLFTFKETPIAHIRLSEWADLLLVVPCTANVMAKVAAGIADDCLTSTVLAAASPVLLAPAMNVRMWTNRATQASRATLSSRGISFVEPDSGRLACGDVGEGKLASVDSIVEAALAALGISNDLAGRRILITAGPTHEAIDPVRYIANASSGKMGYAIAEAALRHGARVTLVSGPCFLSAPEGAEVVRVTSAAEMHEAALSAFPGCDVAVCAAAVADYTPAHPADHKLKKGAEPLSSIELVETEDILGDLCAQKGDRMVVGFAAETNDLVEHARAKLERKGCDLIVANDVSRLDSTFGSDTDAVTLVEPAGAEELPCLPKREVAERIMGRIVEQLGASSREAR